MGYFEHVCQLCGVSFAIARLRRADEPEDASWSYTGEDFVTVDEDMTDGVCGEDSGCSPPGEGEHIAGPGCVSEQGYSGHRISLEEMKGCRKVQCLVKKVDPDACWMVEDGDEGFEIEGKYFLSGVGDGSPDEGPLEDLEPVRHGVENVLLSNTNELELDEDFALPFHPTCFDMYKRVCQMRFGQVDAEGLYQWRELGCDYESFFEEFPRDPAIKSANDQWWIHQPGCENLVANPIDIPGLPQLIRSLEKRAHKSTTFGGTKVADDGRRNAVLPNSNKARDPFSLLSAEITGMILDNLGSKDIANLRLATPVFRQLPTIMFRRLLMEDMPWLFEVEGLDVAKFDWYEFYCAMKSSSKNLKGLRNRKRIWQDLEEIIRRIDDLRKTNQIPPIEELTVDMRES